MLYKDEAVVLRTMRYAEADRIVTFLGRAGGKIRGIAKGVRKTKSRFGGRLEPFSRVSLVLWRGRSGLDTVTQVEVLEPFRTLREDLDRFAMGEVMLEAVDRMMQDGERSPRTFTLLVDSLRALASPQISTQQAGQLVLAGFLLRLAGLAGFAPTFMSCAECGAEPRWFSPGQGGAVCGSCRMEDSDEVTRGTLELMRDIVEEGAWMEVSKAATDEVLLTARNYTEYHLERKLKAAGAAATILAG